MVNLIARDIATSERGQDDFPFVRNFDPYEGHSWAEGNATFLVMVTTSHPRGHQRLGRARVSTGEFTGNKQMRDLGVYLYVTEIASVLNYWFDIHGIVFDPAVSEADRQHGLRGRLRLQHLVDRGPRQIHGINLLPITSASVYLAQISA